MLLIGLADAIYLGNDGEDALRLEEMIRVKCINLYKHFAFFALGFVWILDKLEIKATELMLFFRKYRFMFFA
jgi:hypothetical protein